MSVTTTQIQRDGALLRVQGIRFNGADQTEDADEYQCLVKAFSAPGKGAGRGKAKAAQPAAVVLEAEVVVTVEGTHRLAMKRKHVSSVEALAKALAKGMPAGEAPSAPELLEMRMRVSYDESGERRGKLDPAQPLAMAQAAVEAHELFVWRRKQSTE